MFIAETRTFKLQNAFAHAEKPFNCSARGQRSFVLDEQFLKRCICKGIISSIYFAGTADRNPSILFPTSSFLAQIGWTNNQKICRY